ILSHSRLFVSAAYSIILLETIFWRPFQSELHSYHWIIPIGTLIYGYGYPQGRLEYRTPETLPHLRSYAPPQEGILVLENPQEPLRYTCQLKYEIARRFL